MKKVILRANGTRAVEEINTDPSMTDQHFRDECDINNILKGVVSKNNIQFALRKGTYGDFSQTPDYQTAMETIANANSTFSSLPSRLRSKFENNPQKLIDYLKDDKNLEESYKLGLRNKPVVASNPVVEGLGKLQKSVDENTETIKKRSSKSS